MAWKLVNPNITNDPSYLEPRLSNDESNISNNTTSLAENMSRIKNIVVDAIQDFGAKNDFNTSTKTGTDNTQAIQNAIDSLAITGGVVFFPQGQYLFTGTLTLKKGVTLEGSLETTSRSNQSGVIFNHIPTVSGTNFLNLDAPDVEGYVWNVGIKNINVYGNTNSSVGLNLIKIAESVVENVKLFNFNENIIVSNSMTTDFTNVSSKGGLTSCLHIQTGVATTTDFYNCYFGQTAGNFTSRPIIIDKETCIGINFYSVTIESTELGCSLGSGNTINFENAYTENVPNHNGGAQGHGAAFIFEIGKDGGNSPAKTGVYTFKGGTLLGSNFSIESGSAIFNVDYLSTLVVIGCKLARAGNTILKTTNSKITTFIGCTEEQIATGVDLCNADGTINIIANYSTFYSKRLYDHLRSYTMGGQADKYLVQCVYSQTPTDLTFQAPNNVKPLILDSNGNVHMFGETTNAVNITGGGALFIAPTNPSIGAGTFSSAGLYVATVDSLAVPSGIRGDKTKVPLNMGLSGTTAQRPTSGRYIGMPYFDTTLNKPIYYNGSGWVDGTGTTV